MRHGDSKDQHLAKLAKKRKELERKGWSEERIKQFLRDWGMFNPTTYTSRKRADAK